MIPFGPHRVHPKERLRLLNPVRGIHAVDRIRAASAPAWDGRATRQTPCYSIAMGDDSATVVICEACGDRVAEIVAGDRRALCSECHLAENRPKTLRQEKRNPEE